MKLVELFQSKVKSLDDLGTMFMAGAIVLAGLGGFIHVNVLVALGLASFGGAVVTWGASGMQRGEMPLFARGVRLTERVDAVLARLWGIVFIILGLSFLGYGILSIFSPRSPIPAAFQAFFATTQGGGVTWLIGSSVGMLFAVTLIFTENGDGGNRVTQLLSNLYTRFLGLVLLVVFIGVAGVSLLQIFFPETWTSLVVTFLDKLGLP